MGVAAAAAAAAPTLASAIGEEGCPLLRAAQHQRRLSRFVVSRPPTMVSPPTLSVFLWQVDSGRARANAPSQLWQQVCGFTPHPRTPARLFSRCPAVLRQLVLIVSLLLAFFLAPTPTRQQQGAGPHMAGAVAVAAAGQPSKSVAAYRSLELCDRLKLEIGNITSEIG